MANMPAPTRRTLLSLAAAAVAGVAAVPASAGSIPQTAVKYQTSPNDGKQCSLCKLFIPGPSDDAKGTCKSVAGEIDPHGYCILFAAKA